MLQINNYIGCDNNRTKSSIYGMKNILGFKRLHNYQKVKVNIDYDNSL